MATEEKKRENREFLVVEWDADSPLLQGLSISSVQARHDVAEGGVVELLERLRRHAQPSDLKSASHNKALAEHLFDDGTPLSSQAGPAPFHRD